MAISRIGYFRSYQYWFIGLLVRATLKIEMGVRIGDVVSVTVGFMYYGPCKFVLGEGQTERQTV